MNLKKRMWTIQSRTLHIAVVLLTAVSLLNVASCASAASKSYDYDLVLANGRVMDPESGLDAVRHIGVTEGRIVKISETALDGNQTIDASGLVVAPGFIDLHAHGQDNKANEYQAMDGVTTALELEAGTVGVNDWYASREGRAVINFGASSSHPRYRALVMSGGNREPGEVSDEQWGAMMGDPAWSHEEASPEQLEALLARVEEGIREGGLGIGTAHQYTPGARREEIFRIFQLANKYGLTVFSHIRYGSAIPPDTFNAVQEMIADSMASGAPSHICHINSSGGLQTPIVLELIEGANRNGVDITTEVYPYTAASTFIGAAIFDEGFQDRIGISYDAFQWVATGERLSKETFEKFRKEQPGGAVVIHFMKPEMVEYAVAHPLVAIASDGLSWETGGEHPRGAGTFSRVLGYYVRERQTLPLMEALRKMTLMPAQRLESFVPQMKNKGRIREGSDADITVFNPDTVIDRATFEEPMQYSEGIEYVLVGGTLVVKQGEFVKDVFPGKAVRRPVQQFAGLAGIWQSEGYGDVFEISNGSVKAFEVSDVSCLPNLNKYGPLQPGNGKDVEAYMTRQMLEHSLLTEVLKGNDANEKYLHTTAAVSSVRIEKIEGLPEVCKQPVPNTPRGNFDVFWQTFQEHYPFFAMKNIDWEDLKSKYRPAIDSEMPDASLFQLLVNSMEPLEDAHIGLVAEAMKKKYLGHRSDMTPLIPEQITRIHDIVQNRYLQGDMHRLCNNKIMFGTIKPGVRYVNYDGFMDFSSEGKYAEELSCSEEALNEIFSTSSPLSALIIDARTNDGGYDTLAIAFASRLTQDTQSKPQLTPRTLSAGRKHSLSG